MRANVSEIFYSIQGEGTFIGLPAVFIRFCGCNLRCDFCDTKYAIDCKNFVEYKDILRKIKNFETKNVIFTGGEPTLQDEFMAFFMQNNQEYNYFLETNGTIFPQKSIKFFSHIVISPKMFAIKEDIIEKFNKLQNIEFKFVVNVDFENEINLVNKLRLKNVVLQPIWLNDNKDTYIQKMKAIIEKVKFLSLNFRVIPQLHKILYSDDRGI